MKAKGGRNTDSSPECTSDSFPATQPTPWQHAAESLLHKTVAISGPWESLPR